MAQDERTLLAAFSVDHAARLTGLSKSRLTRWDRLGFFSPEYVGDGDRGNPYARVYSYGDLVGLRTLKILADEHNVSLAELRKAAAELERRSSRPWSEIPVGVLKGKVLFDLDTAPRNADGEYALKVVLLGPIAQAVEQDAQRLRERDANDVGRIENNRFVVHNADVVAGTRIPVAAIESFIDAGYDNPAIIAEYPTLTPGDIDAVRQRAKAVA
jgi:DNA-binding transcriptional MerR regulator